MRRSKPDLLFGPGSNSGFTPSGIAAFDDLRPAAVVRELIQNALDAAKAAGKKRAVVHFRLSKTNLNEIPGIDSYQKAFRLAVESQREMNEGELPQQAKLVVNRILNVLPEELIDVLTVTDNGIGLNQRRMDALLSDGLSVKGKNATGTYGNGHSTAIPASDLRYVLYGGLTEDGNRIASGHAVLASHFTKGNRKHFGGDGFYTLGSRVAKGGLYEYPSKHRIPKLIASELDRIQKESSHGSAVMIPAFNNFLEEKSLWEMVSQAASANFFVAIAEGEIEVVVEDSRDGSENELHTLNKSTLSKVLENHRDQQRSASFLSGRKAYEAHNTYRFGNHHVLTTQKGTLDIYIDANPSGQTRFDLCRNGMWITKEIPGFSGRFTDYTPFRAILSVNAKSGGELHSLVQTAEGPLHDNIVVKNLSSEDQKALRNAFKEIRDWFLSSIPKIKSESFVSEDFLALDFGTNGAGGGTSNMAFSGAPMVIGRRPAQQFRLFQDEFGTPGEGKKSGKGKGKRKSPSNKSRKRPALLALFQATSCPIGDYRRRFQIKFPRGCENARMRLLVDEGLDATCDRHGQDEYTPILLNNVVVDDSPVNDDDLEFWKGIGAVGVKLGDVAAGATIAIESDIKVVGDFAELPNPALRIEIFRAPPQEAASSSAEERPESKTK